MSTRPSRRGCAAILAKARNEGLFTPQTLDRDQISIPGELGGSNWGGARGRSDDRHARTCGTADQPAIHTHCRRARGIRATAGHAAATAVRRAAASAPAAAARSTGLHALHRDRSGRCSATTNGLPAISPPWAQIVAYDLNEGTIKWRAPLGIVRALAAKGIKDTGNAQRVHRNGPVVTAGGLIFIGTNADGYVRAFDKDTGKVLWERALDANPEGMAAVLRSRRTSVRRVLRVALPATVPEGNIAIFPGKPEAQGYYVFALPKNDAGERSAISRRSRIDVRLKGKVALVTGASRGIGRGIAEVFADEGADVAVNYVASADAAPRKSPTGDPRRRAAAPSRSRRDVAKRADVEPMIDKVWKELGPIDILVNNAGIETIVPFLELTDEQWTRLVDVNLRGAWLCSQVFCRRALAEGRKGSIVHIGSIQAAKVLPGRTHYAPTKLGLEALTRNMSAEMTPQGIRVNCVHPGLIDTT